jgi:hypothetical protein
VYLCTLLKSPPFSELLIVPSLTSRIPPKRPPLLLGKKTLFKKYCSPVTPCLPRPSGPTSKKEPRGSQSMCYNVHVQRGTAARCADPMPPDGRPLPRAEMPAPPIQNPKSKIQNSAPHPPKENSQRSLFPINFRPFLKLLPFCNSVQYIDLRRSLLPPPRILKDFSGN